MSQVIFSDPIELITGKLADKTVCRTKKFIVGNKVVQGPHEIYHKRKRDYKLHPLQPGEKRNTELFRLADQRRAEIMADPEQLAAWKERFAAQATKPDPAATRCYTNFRAFVRTIIYLDLRAQASNINAE